MEKSLYFLMVGLGVLAFLMLFKSIRELVLGVFGAKSVWGLLWSTLSVIINAHIVVLQNFAPRSVVLPTLDTKKTTNAED